MRCRGGRGAVAHDLSCRRHPRARRPAIRGLLPLPHDGIQRREGAVSKNPKAKKEVVFSRASRVIHKHHPLGVGVAPRRF
jgi:hypothetical protein